MQKNDAVKIGNTLSMGKWLMLSRHGVIRPEGDWPEGGWRNTSFVHALVWLFASHLKLIILALLLMHTKVMSYVQNASEAWAERGFHDSCSPARTLFSQVSIMHWRRLPLAFVASMPLWSITCALSQTEFPVIHRPASVVASQEEVERLIEREAKGEASGKFKFYVTDFNFGLFTTRPKATGAVFEKDAVVLQLDRGEPVRLPYESLDKVTVIHRRVLSINYYGVLVKPDLALIAESEMGGLDREEKGRHRSRAIALADALFSLYKFKFEDSRDEARFAEQAAEYRAASPKPVITEDMRKYRVQAEFMIRDKRFADAARLYGEALKLGPWWPEGRYNRALVLAEMRRYREAIQEMKRFLQLELNSPDARAVQNQIYQWEAAANLEPKR